MNFSKEEIQKGLNQLVAIEFLKENHRRYSYGPKWKETLMKSKGRTRLEVVLDALIRGGYFRQPKTEREIDVVCNLLLLRGDK